MGTMVYSLLWVMKDLYDEQYPLNSMVESLGWFFASPGPVAEAHAEELGRFTE